MTAAPLRSHPVTETVARVREDVRAVAETPVWSMPPGELGEVLVAVTRLAAQVAQLQMRLLAQAERSGVGQEVGATSAANWLAHTTRTTRPAVHRAARLAGRLEDAHADVDTALANAEITLDQAQVIVDAVDALPTDLVTIDTITEAESYLLEQARDHDATALRILGRRLLDVLDPAAADAEEARRLEKEEADARAKASFTMADDGHGSCHGRFSIPSLHGSVLRKALMAFAAPKRNPDLPANTPTRHQLGRAFCEYIESRREDAVPHSGGVAATVVVTMTIETLMGDLKAAGCATAPGSPPPLDIGRTRLFHTKAQRVAMGATRRRVHRRRMRSATGMDPRPSRATVGPRRRRQPRQRPAALPAAPHGGP